MGGDRGFLLDGSACNTTSAPPRTDALIVFDINAKQGKLEGKREGERKA